MGKKHSPGFLAIVNDAKSRVEEVHASEMPRLIQDNPSIRLIDVREDSEYAAGHVTGAEHIGKGVIERDIEKLHPDKNEPLYLYCGGGFRSALVADNLQKMGYTKAVTVDGGWSVLKEIFPTES
jgi:rhodanese-related sulfurtransferase